MKGTDCTSEQLASARQFLHDRRVARGASSPDSVGDNVTVEVRYGDFVRMIAWYGALRFMAGRDGTGGTLEKPGELR